MAKLDTPYNVLDVSRYVINYSNEKKYGISNLKLQKILYFIQAFFLINSPQHKPCFEERIEAWDFGPVVPKAYHEYKQYGSMDIPDMLSFIEFDEKNIWNSERKYFDSDKTISREHQSMINEVVDFFANYSATALVTLTHNQAPWASTYVPCMNKEITIDTIMEYFYEQ